MAEGVNPVVDTNLGPAATPQTNPITSAGGIVGVMSDLAEMRNRQNANLLFQSQMSARHKLGEDLAVWHAKGLSPEEQITQASHQPYAPFVTPELGNLRASNLNALQVQQVQQNMRSSGLAPVAAALAATGGDPDKFPAAFDTATAGLTPELKATLAPAYAAMKTFATTNLPANSTDHPTARQDAFQTNLRNLGTAFGLPLDKAYAMTGGIAPTLTKVMGPQGQENSAIVSGGGAAPPSATVLSTGPTLAAAKFAEARTGSMNDYMTNLDDRVKTGQQIMQTVAPAWEAMQDLKKSGQSPGGLASARMAIAQVAQGLGASPETVDKISKLSDTQEISKLMVNTTMAQITQQLPATSKVAVSEFNAFTKNNPNLDTDPRAIEKIFNFWSKMYGINRTEQSSLNEFLAKGGNISEWPVKWQKEAEEKGFVNPNPTGTGGAGAKRPPISSFFK